MKDYYDILGVSPQATQQEIKGRFRHLSHTYHPDKFFSSYKSEEAEEMFKLKNEAYQVLSSLESRNKYDDEWATQFAGQYDEEPDIEVPKGLKKVYVVAGITLIMIVAGVAFALFGISQKGLEESTPSTIPVVPDTPVNYRREFPVIQAVLNTTRDAFLSETEFQKHQRDAVDAFNLAVQQHNPKYQAATATLSNKGFNANSGKLSLSLDWNVWTKQLDRDGFVSVTGSKAKALLGEQRNKPVYMYLDIVEDKIRISKIAMIGLGEEMVVSFLPGGTVKRDPISGMDFVWIPGRSFTMGCSSTNEDCQDSEKAAHEVCVNGFWMGRYEVTYAQWEEIMGSDRSTTQGNPSVADAGNYPVMTFSDEFLNRINKKAGKDLYRLPSEAEWEYAARAGASSIYSFGDEPNRLGKYAWYRLNSGGAVQPVGQLKPNKWGLYDMHGNVWELCQDSWHPNYNNAPSDGRVWTDGDKTFRVVRGGGFEDSAYYLRCASRSVSECNSDNQFHRLGFRLVRTGGFLNWNKIPD